MSEYIAFDSHKRYTWVDRQDHSTGETRCHRLEHAPGAVREYLRGCEPGTAVAVEATGNWYFAEAANSVAVNHLRCPDRHVSRLYHRLRARKGHPKAVGAVARHLAEATFHVLRKKQIYRDPAQDGVCTNPG